MVLRNTWLQKINQLWSERSLIWLSGVRRSGKTVLCQSISDMEYFDCDLPSVRERLRDPESFLRSMLNKKVIIDEIHRLDNPSELLKIAADHFPGIKIIATGSSTLGASAKFRDTLTGRKRELWLTPMTLNDASDFNLMDLDHRLHFGGLPPFFLKKAQPQQDFQEWMDSYWAKDIQELFRIERKFSFSRFAELLFVQSGSAFEASRFATPCEVSRSTISNYLALLEATYVAHIIRPFNTRMSKEIVAIPRVYTFDTGFVAYYNGWRELRSEDIGLLWEHYVLNDMMAALQTRDINYWRDKEDHEIDFVIRQRTGHTITIECKTSARKFDGYNLSFFRKRYPEGKNFVVCTDIVNAFDQSFRGNLVRFVGLNDLIKELKKEANP